MGYIDDATKIAIYLDNNVWDFFYNNKFDLVKELPPDEFSLWITGEAKFEIDLMPTEKQQYAKNAIKKCNIKTDEIFNFYDERFPLEKQPGGGFGDKNNPEIGGRWITDSEQNLRKSEAENIGPQKRKTGLYRNEADVSLAEKSLHSAVLTFDNKGPLKHAKDNHNGMVINLKNYINRINRREKLAEFIKSELDHGNSYIGE